MKLIVSITKCDQNVEPFCIFLMKPSKVCESRLSHDQITVSANDVAMFQLADHLCQTCIVSLLNVNNRILFI